MKKVLRFRVVVPAVFFLSVATAIAAPAQTFTLLYSFAAKHGSNPDGLVRDPAGNLYGTTTYGGLSGSYGTVFKLDTTGTETVLHPFTGGRDGGSPYAGLVRDASGNLYGTTRGGGDVTCGCGTVFKIDASGKETVLHSFTGHPTDGSVPVGALVRDEAGNLYGTTVYGGASDIGTVFKVDAAGTETVLYSFTGGTGDGEQPYAGLVRDAAGNLYGTTYYGGFLDFGTVFKLDATGIETVLHTFSGGPADGKTPDAGLILGAAGNLYGTTLEGGNHGLGVVFRLDATGKETVMHSFAGGATDGQYPAAGLLRDTAGNLYGTTAGGGAFNMGTVFKLDTSSTLTVLHSFSGADGDTPDEGLIRDAVGNLYGTAYFGGANNQGTVFRLTP